MAGITNIVQGKNCIFRVNVGNGHAVIMCAKSFTVAVDTEIKETTSRGSGIYREFDYKSLAWKVSLTTILKVVDEDGDPTAFDLMYYQQQFLELPIQAVFQDNNSQVRQFSGTCIVAGSSLGAQAGQLADGNFELQGTGAYQITNLSGDACDNSITAITINGGSDLEDGDNIIIGNTADVSITITELANMIATVSRYDYELDDNGRNSAFGDGSIPFTLPTIDDTTISVGSHVLKIWPICDNGFDGTMFTINLTKQTPD